MNPRSTDPATATPDDTYRPGFITWAGLFIVWLAAAVLSFASLRDLAASCRVNLELAPLLPIVIDVGAAVATRAWLSRRANPDAEKFARALTWALLVLTVVLNAAHQGMVANAVTPPWQVAVLVGAIPPAVVGSTVHLAVVLGRAQTVSSTAQTASAPKTPVVAPAPRKTPAKTRSAPKTADSAEAGRQKELRRARNQRYAAKRQAQTTPKTLQAVSA